MTEPRMEESFATSVFRRVLNRLLKGYCYFVLTRIAVSFLEGSWSEGSHSEPTTIPKLFKYKKNSSIPIDQKYSGISYLSLKCGARCKSFTCRYADESRVEESWVLIQAKIEIYTLRVEEISNMCDAILPFFHPIQSIPIPIHPSKRRVRIVRLWRLLSWVLGNECYTLLDVLGRKLVMINRNRDLK